MLLLMTAGENGDSDGEDVTVIVAGNDADDGVVGM